MFDPETGRRVTSSWREADEWKQAAKGLRECWERRRDAAVEKCGLTSAMEKADRLLGRDIKLYDDVAQIRATSVAGLKAKAGLIKNLDDDDHRAVAQSIIDDVLALGGVQS
jgi:hypothetical protein